MDIDILVKHLRVFAIEMQSDVALSAANLIDSLQGQNEALRAENEILKAKKRKSDVDLLKALMYAPSSPVSPDKAYEIEVWYGKLKQLSQAAKGEA